MKPYGLAALVADLALHVLVACVVAFLVCAVLRALRPMGAIEHHLAAKIAGAALRVVTWG
jgi:hypothetical protein